jgi:3-methyladenine DNA glycosylase Tag
LGINFKNNYDSAGIRNEKKIEQTIKMAHAYVELETDLAQMCDKLMEHFIKNRDDEAINIMMPVIDKRTKLLSLV